MNATDELEYLESSPRLSDEPDAADALRRHVAKELGCSGPVSEEDVTEWMNSLANSMVLRWHEHLSVGNAALDADHKYFIGIINQAEDSLIKLDRAGLKKIVQNLALYSQEHFAKEEKIADAAGYPDMERLHHSHADLADKLQQIRQEMEKDLSLSSIVHFSAFLRDWLLDHVMQEDMLMKPFLIKCSSARAAAGITLRA